MAAKKASTLWRYNRITGYWDAERSCITNATCEDWLNVYQKDEPQELFKVAVRKPSGTSATDKAKLWNIAPKQNPAPKRKTAARTQKAAVGYVNRVSQVTKKAPTKRLKKRRTINLQTPRGVFPNPAKRTPKYPSTRYRIMSFSGKKIIGFADTLSDAQTIVKKGRGRFIQEFDKQGGMYFARPKQNPAPRPGTEKTGVKVQKDHAGKWMTFAEFPKTPDGAKNAIEYAKAYHVAHPTYKIRVME